jgi:hypothetical protein
MTSNDTYTYIAIQANLPEDRGRLIADFHGALEQSLYGVVRDRFGRRDWDLKGNEYRALVTVNRGVAVESAKNGLIQLLERHHARNVRILPHEQAAVLAADLHAARTPRKQY